MKIIKKYEIEYTFDTDTNTEQAKRTNDGFTSIELLGILEKSKLDIYAQIRGIIKPQKKVKRVLLKEACDAEDK